MPLYLVNARDKANALDLRMATRAEHLRWAAKFADRIAAAGPVLAEDGETMIGSTFIISFDSLQAARDWAAQDPYAKAGVFGSVEVIAFKWAIGEGKPENG